MEIWKDVKGYEGYYKVSNLGRVNSLNKLAKVSNNGVRVVQERILKPYINSSGYKVVNLSANAKRIAKSIHSLVAESFFNHISDGHKLVIDHINNIKTDNNLSNLQIITHRKNCSKDRKGYFSKYVGVGYNKKNNKWVSTISIDSKSTFLGSFDTELRASIAYNFALTQLDKLKEYNLTR